MSNFVVKSINEFEYSKIIKKINDIPLYMNINAIKFYEKNEFVKVTKGNEIICLFAFPLYKNNNGDIWVKRNFRFLPYCSPLFLKKLDTIHYKRVIYELFKYIFQKYSVVYLPLDPSFKYISSLQNLGAFIECRSTNIVKSNFESQLNSKVKNHINHAKKIVSITEDDNYKKFRFDIAIKGTAQEINNRSKMAINLIKNRNGKVFTAFKNNKAIAGVIIVFDYNSAILLHSWQNKDTERGTIPYLIYYAILWCFKNLNIKYFDFEGSVIKTIDDFFAEFNTEILIYPYIHFGKNKDELFKIIDRSINIDGRILNE